MQYVTISITEYYCQLGRPKMYILFVCIIMTKTLIMKQKMHGNRDNAQSSVYSTKYTLKIIIQQ